MCLQHDVRTVREVLGPERSEPHSTPRLEVEVAQATETSTTYIHTHIQHKALGPLLFLLIRIVVLIGPVEIFGTSFIREFLYTSFASVTLLSLDEGSPRRSYTYTV